MAVDKSKVITRLKALFPKANLSQKRLDAIADKLAKKPADDADDTAIDAVINDFNDVMSIEDIAKEDDKVRQLEADKKKAEEAAKNKSKSKGNSDDEDDDDEDDDDSTLSPTDKLLKGLTKTVEKLAGEVSTIKSGNVKQTKLQEAQALLEKSEVFKGLDEETKSFMLKNVELESETPFDEQITSLEGVFSKFVQSSADANQFPGAAGGGNPSNTVDEKMVDEVLNDI